MTVYANLAPFKNIPKGMTIHEWECPFTKNHNITIRFGDKSVTRSVDLNLIARQLGHPREFHLIDQAIWRECDRVVREMIDELLIKEI